LGRDPNCQPLLNWSIVAAVFLYYFFYSTHTRVMIIADQFEKFGIVAGWHSQ
jgi:hypothetical protein